MANQKRKKPVTRKKQVEKDEGLKPYEDEIIIVVTLVLCILLILSNFHMCGIVGVWVSRLFFGLFGFMNYMMPFGIFVGMAFYLSNKGSRKASRKLVSVIALMFVLMALLQLGYMPYEEGTHVSEYYEVSSESRLGGGLAGGFINGVLSHFFGGVGSAVILIGIGLLLSMFISEKLFFAPMGKRGYQKVQEIKETRRVQKEEYEQSAAEQKPPVKRKAKTFTIEKEPKKEEKVKQSKVSAKETVDKDGVVKKEKTGRRGRKTSVDMEEITPSGIDNISIVRAETPKDNGSIPIYEEELMQKFKPVHGEAKTDLDEFDNVYADVMNQTSAQKNQSVKSNPVKLVMEAKNHKPRFFQKEEKTKKEEGIPKIDFAEPLNPAAGMDAVILQRDVSADTFQAQPSVRNHSQDIPASSMEYADREENDGILAYDPIPDISPVKSLPAMEPLPQKAAEERRKSENPKKDTSDKDSQDSVHTELNALRAGTPAEIPYQHPTLDLLQKPSHKGGGMSDEELKQTALKLHKTLESFGVKVTITNVSCGPTVTRYELHPEQGVKVSKITGLADDIKLNLAAADVRIEAPIPGKAAVGIEVPNKENSAVMLRELLESSEFQKHSSHIAFAVGKDIAGKTVVSDIAKMPHLLIAGATGSGKSVCINTLIMSILYKADPNDVKVIMVDPKVVELSVYNGIPHLLIPVVTDPKKASAALNWAVAEMTERYNKFAELGVRDLKGYNAKVAKVEELEEERFQKMPQIVIIVDELADLMMVAPGEVEEAICRLAQLARAAGIHLIIATQRPSVNVITGVIKANIPSRIAFSVSSAVDSRTILDGAGAEKLLGKGDMLFYPAGYAKPIRVQGAFVSDQEVSSVVEFLTQDVTTVYDNTIVEKISSQAKAGAAGSGPSNDRDEYFVEAAKFIVEKDKASIGMLQRVFKIGFNRASRIMDQLYEAGVVGDEEGTKPRKVVMSMEQLEEYIDEQV